jgi:eukaryotic-like serine/threonine-protein kinase
LIGKRISHYQIEAELGRGGMGVVYRAQDTDLDRFVAMKFLSPELTQDSGARGRFLNEAKAAAALNHPNIATIYEIGEAEGHVFIAMECVAGKSLQAILASGPLSQTEAETITLQVARGLAQAHRKGVVHRDIKPGNILITGEGEVKIVDFGVALLAGQSRMTIVGTTIGTIAYMSPEQAQCDEVTHLTDLWALAVVHYEMLTGELPFQGANANTLIYSIIHNDPHQVTEHNPELPPDQESFFHRALAKKPADRFQSAQELAGAIAVSPPDDFATRTMQIPTLDFHKTKRRLRRWLPISLGLVLVLLVGVLGGRMLLKTNLPGGFSERDWLLIGDFQTTDDQDNLQRALHEALVIDMQQSRYVNVFAGSRLRDALVRMGRTADIDLTAELCTELALREAIPAVLVGSISQLGGTYLLTAQLIIPSTGEAILAKRVEASSESELLPALDELSMAIRERLGESLGSIRTQDQPLASVTTASLKALGLFSQGNRAFLASDWNTALTMLNQAVATDSTFAMAYAKLARIHFFNANTRDALDFSELAFRWRERLTQRERLYIEGEYHRYRAQYDEAISNLEALLAKYPDDLESRSNLATTYQLTMQYLDALQELEKHDKHYKQTWYYHQARGNALSGLKRYDEAVDSFELALEINPSRLRTRMCLSGSLFAKGDVAAAMANLDSLSAGVEARVLGTDYMMSKVLMAMGQFDLSLQSLTAARNQALAFDNMNQVAWTQVYSGFCQDRLGQYPKAEQAYTAAVEIWPGDYPLLYLGKVQARLGQWDDASESRDRLADLFARESTHSNKQFLLKMESEMARYQGDLSTAITLLQQCLPNYMFNLDSHFTLGRIFLDLGLPAAARENFQFIVDHRYSVFLEGLGFLWPLAEYQLGLVAEHEGKAKEAVDHYEAFLQIWSEADAELAEVKDAQKRLESMK